MRIDRIRVDAFGRLHDLDTGPDPLERLVVVLGPNEAGKSTLFTFLTTALYGFSPATRERNPHVPWGSDEAAGSVRVRLDQGGCAEIERTLRSQPSGRLTRDGSTTDLRNQAVPWVGHVPRTVFRQVFAVTLAELAGLDGETWARIQDKMIGSMGAADLASARAVAEVLEREAGEIWRPNRRGNQRLRDLQATLRELRGERSAAQERDARIRRLVEEREALRAELQEVREKRQLDRAEVDRARSLLPVKRQLDRVAGLREEGGPRDDLEGLHGDPPARLAELRRKRAALDEALARIDEDVQEREAVVARARTAGPLLAHREQIRRFVAASAGSDPDRVRARELEGEVGDVEARLDAAAATVLDGSWRDVASEKLTAVPTELVRERVARARALETEPGSARPSAGPFPWVGLVAGGALLAWGVVTGQALPAVLGAAALAGSLAWLAALRRGRPVRRASGTHTPTGRAARAEGGAAPGSVAELLDGLPVRREHLARPGEGLVVGLERVRELSRHHGELVRALEAARRRVAKVDRDAADLAGALERSLEGGAEALAHDLDAELRDAERLQDAARTAEREASRLRRERERARAERDGVAAEVDDLSRRGAALGGGDPGRGLEAARSRLGAHERADQIEDELERGHPDLDGLRLQIQELDRAGHAWAVDEAAVARARARIEAHDERIEDLLTRGEALEAELARLRELDTVDAVDGEAASLRGEESRLTRERDRKWVLARLLRQADRRFREEHQPDLVRRTGSYLRHLTGGRYERLVIDETHEDHLFHLVGPTLPAPVPLAPPVSTGTLEQAYLSLRLAIVDHLDQGGERLPLFVDEVFVNWDGDRRARGLELLGTLAEARQVFVFTCHRSVAVALEERGARVLELPGRPVE